MIRRARESDWEAARALWREVDELHARLAPGYFRETARAEPEWRELLSSVEAAVFVAEAGEEVGEEDREGGGGREDRKTRGAPLAGIVSVRVYETPPDPSMVPMRRGHVELLVVSSTARRRGVGTRLMREVASWARRQGAAELVLTVWAGNEAAEAFYARLGYGVLSRVMSTTLG